MVVLALPIATGPGASRLQPSPYFQATARAEPARLLGQLHDRQRCSTACPDFGVAFHADVFVACARPGQPGYARQFHPPACRSRRWCARRRGRGGDGGALLARQLPCWRMAFSNATFRSSLLRCVLDGPTGHCCKQRRVGEHPPTRVAHYLFVHLIAANWVRVGNAAGK